MEQHSGAISAWAACRIFGALLCALVVLVTVAAEPEFARGITGGPRAPITDAPWTVRITSPDGELCTGVIISAVHVVTAAHCAEASDGTIETLRVRAGISSVNADEETATLQVRDVISVAVHPYYDPTSLNDDVAVLTVAPLDFSGSSVQPLAVATTSAEPSTRVRVVGWGSQTGGWLPYDHIYDGYLHTLDETVSNWTACDAGADSFPLTDICATSPQGSACSGDSGAALVLADRAPELVGLDSEGSVYCSAGDTDDYVNVAMPEVRAFLEGDLSPPEAPRGGSDVTITADGALATCHPGSWSGDPTYRFIFVDHDSGALLQSGASAIYVVPYKEAGHEVDCQVVASNPGGSVEAEVQNSVVVQGLPRLSLRLADNGYRITVVNGDSPVHLTVSNRRVRMRVGDIATSDGQPTTVSFPRLPPGQYKVCLRSDATGRPYVSGQTCIAQRVAPASSLVRLRAARRVGGRWVVELGAARPLRRRRVAVRWQLAQRTLTRTVVLRAVSRLASPASSGASVLRLSIVVATFSSGHTTYNRSAVSYRLVAG